MRLSSLQNYNIYTSFASPRLYSNFGSILFPSAFAPVGVFIIFDVSLTPTNCSLSLIQQIPLVFPPPSIFTKNTEIFVKAATHRRCGKALTNIPLEIGTVIKHKKVEALQLCPKSACKKQIYTMGSFKCKTTP